MRKTQISTLRAGGKGIAGTYENIDCHASGVEVFARALEPLAPDWASSPGSKATTSTNSNATTARSTPCALCGTRVMRKVMVAAITAWHCLCVSLAAKSMN